MPNGNTIEAEVATEDALAEIVAHIPQLTRWTSEQRPVEGIAQRRLWCRSAGTFTYQTSVAERVVGAEALERIVEVFFNASRLPAQPWYPAFLGGRVLERQLALDRKSTRLNSSHYSPSRMPSSA